MSAAHLSPRFFVFHLVLPVDATSFLSSWGLVSEICLGSSFIWPAGSPGLPLFGSAMVSRPCTSETDEFLSNVPRCLLHRLELSGDDQASKDTVRGEKEWVLQRDGGKRKKDGLASLDELCFLVHAVPGHQGGRADELYEQTARKKAEGSQPCRVND